MMSHLVSWCLEWRLLVFAFVALVAGFGIKRALDLPIDAVPDITNVQVQILTNAPALGPLDVERRITAPVESAMSGLPGVEEIRSVSRFGLSAVTVVFAEGTDLMRTRQLVGERLVDARASVTDGSPEMGPISSGLGEILQFEVKSDRMSPRDGPPLPTPPRGCATRRGHAGGGGGAGGVVGYGETGGEGGRGAAG